MTFLALFGLFTSKKIEMNPFSGSTILWSILEEYDPFKVLILDFKLFDIHYKNYKNIH